MLYVKARCFRASSGLAGQAGHGIARWGGVRYRFDGYGWHPSNGGGIISG